MRYNLLIFVSLIALSVDAQGDKWTSHPDTSIFHYYTKNTISLNELRAEAGNSRILVYYYQHFNIHANNFNGKVLNDPVIIDFIKSNFYPIAIDLDIDRFEPSEADSKRNRVYRKFLEEQAYYVKVTPAFSIYNPEGVLRGTKTFIRADESTREPFLEFLKKRLK